MDYFKDHKLMALKEEIHVIKVKFRELKLLTYPDSDVKYVILYMENLANQIDEKIDEYQCSNIDMRKLSYLSDVVSIFYNSVCCILNSDIRSNPREMMIPIKEILKRIDSKHLFITEPLTNLNYAVGAILNTEYFLQLLKIIGISFEEEMKIIRLLFPVLHQSDILGGAVMGHELGHYLDIHYSMNLTDKILVEFMNKINHADYFKFFGINKDYNININPIDLVKSEIPNFVLKNWIQEIVADIIGALLYGLSSYFSLQQVLSVGASIDRDTGNYFEDFIKTHPRNSMRTFVIIETFKKMDLFSNINEELANKIYEYKDVWNTAEKNIFYEEYYETYIDNNINIVINSKYMCKLEEDLKGNLEWIINKIYDEISGISGEIVYDFTQFKETIPIAVEKILNIIPPNEIDGEPLDSITILNAGWIAYILEFDQIRENLSSEESSFIDFEVKEIIDNLLKKATISANIHRRWIHAANK